MPDTPTGFSVLIPAYRAAGTITETLEGVAQQTLRPREILVYEDGCLDDLAAKVRAFAARAPCEVRLLGEGANRGVSHARNVLLQAAAGEFVAFLDADDVWSRDHLACAAAAFSGGADVAFSGVTFIDLAGQPLRGHGTPSAEDLEDLTASLFRYNFVQCTSALCLRRSFLARVGRFDESLSHGEDLDLWLRLVAARARWQYTGRCSCAYRKHGSSAMSQTLLMVERMAVFYEKHLDNPLLPRALRRRALIRNRRAHARLNWRSRPAESARALRRLMALEPWNPVPFVAWGGVVLWSAYLRLKHGADVPPSNFSSQPPPP